MLQRKSANTPKKIEFTLPNSDGVSSLSVLSFHSDQFRFLKSKFRSDIVTDDDDDESKSEYERAAEIEAKLVSFAVCDWDLPDEYGDFSNDGAYNLLLDYPEIRDSVNYFIGNNGNFEKK